MEIGMTLTKFIKRLSISLHCSTFTFILFIFHWIIRK